MGGGANGLKALNAAGAAEESVAVPLVSPADTCALSQGAAPAESPTTSSSSGVGGATPGGGYGG
eukprot:10231447-Prorocentrum_lima.AAC.1